MGNYSELNAFLRQTPQARILILDNNNIQFCYQYEQHFPTEEIFKPYDLILIPQWVHDEVANSESRLLYLARLPKDYLIIDEEEDFLPIIAYQDSRLIKVFEWASSQFPRSRKFFHSLKEQRNRTGEIPDNWIAEYYSNGFDMKRSVAGKQLKKNAGEVSILTLAFILLHCYSEINNITIGTSDMGSVKIKEQILDNARKKDLLRIPSNVPISFQSTDVLLVEAYKAGRLNSEGVKGLRSNPKSTIYVKSIPDGTAHFAERVLSTEEFIDILGEIDKYKIIF